MADRNRRQDLEDARIDQEKCRSVSTDGAAAAVEIRFGKETERSRLFIGIGCGRR